MSSLGLSDSVYARIVNAIGTFDFITRAVVFGSRAKGNYKKYSDVDICLFGDIDSFQAEYVRDTLNDLDVVYDFDVIAYEKTETATLREHIDRVGVEIYARK